MANNALRAIAADAIACSQGVWGKPRAANDHAIFAKPWEPPCEIGAIADEAIASRHGFSNLTTNWAQDHREFEMSCRNASLSVRSDCADRAVNRGLFVNCSKANAQAGLVRSYASNSLSGGMEDAAIAGSKGK